MRAPSFVLCLALLACGGNGTPASGAIGPAGGRVESAGVVVEVPAGALAEEVSIAIAEATGGAPALGSARSKVFAFTPHGLKFAKPVTITLPLTAAAEPGDTVLWAEEGATTWTPVDGATLADGKATARVSAFSYGSVGSADVPLTPTADTFTIEVLDGATEVCSRTIPLAAGGFSKIIHYYGGSPGRLEAEFTTQGAHPGGMVYIDGSYTGAQVTPQDFDFSPAYALTSVTAECDRTDGSTDDRVAGDLATLEQVMYRLESISEPMPCTAPCRHVLSGVVKIAFEVADRTVTTRRARVTLSFPANDLAWDTK